MSYRHILMAVDFSDDADALLERATELARLCEARVSLVHVMENLSLDLGDGMLPGEALGIDEELANIGHERLAALGARFGVDAESCYVADGQTKAEVIALAGEIGADLIVVGHHDRHGLALLLRSTADAVVHTAPCDVLSIHL